MEGLTGNPANINKSTIEANTQRHRDKELAHTEGQDRAGTPRQDTVGGPASQKASGKDGHPDVTITKEKHDGMLNKDVYLNASITKTRRAPSTMQAAGTTPSTRTCTWT